MGVHLRDSTGSPAKGPGQRTQPHAGESYIYHDLEIESCRNLLNAVLHLNEETSLVKRQCGFEVNSQEALVQFSKQIEHLTRAFVVKLSACVSKGGCNGIAQLNAHHITGTCMLRGLLCNSNSNLHI